MDNPFEEIDARLSKIEDMLQTIIDYKNGKDVSDGVEPLMTTYEVARYLNLSLATVYTKTYRGEIPFLKKGKRVYFLKSEILNYLRS